MTEEKTHLLLVIATFITIVFVGWIVTISGSHALGSEPWKLILTTAALVAAIAAWTYDPVKEAKNKAEKAKADAETAEYERQAEDSKKGIPAAVQAKIKELEGQLRAATEDKHHDMREMLKFKREKFELEEALRKEREENERLRRQTIQKT